MNREAAYAAALSGLPGMGPASLARILESHDPAGAWRAVLDGRIERPARARRAGPGQLSLTGAQAPAVRPWSVAARGVDPLSWWEPLEQAGVRVTWRGRPDYPAALVHDPEPPGVLFWMGDLSVLDRPCVAVVGTRNATPDGLAVAFELGRDLAAAGLCVVSGLALGIDGAAHRGCLHARSHGASGPPAGVAASGVDVPYPRRHRALWQQVVAAGVVISENLPGRPAQAWRFPSRNRVIAGLARLVVVVESHACGGSLITAEAALERGVEVRVVPGPVRSPASAGSNQLLYDGPGPVRNARDVLDALGLVLPDAPARTRPPAAGGVCPPGAALSGAGPSDGADTGGPDRSGVAVGVKVAPGPAGRPDPAVTGTVPAGGPDPAGRAILDALGRRPATVGAIMARTGLEAGAVARSLDRLSADGLVAENGGWWARI